MKNIQINKKNGDKSVVYVSNCDFEALNRYKWWISSNGYAIRSVNLNGKRKNIGMAREIMGKSQGLEIDHRDGNRLNNQRENLRFCNHSQNMQNRKAFNKSGLKGVSETYLNIYKYKAHIKVNKKVIYIGKFKTALKAARAYNIYALKYFGEFSRLNNI